MAGARRLKDIPLWTPRWTTETLQRRRGDANSGGERAYRRGFELMAISDEEMSFPSFVLCRTPGVVVGEIRRSSWPKIVGVDLSGEGRAGNAIAVIAVDPSSWRRYLIEPIFGAWKSNELVDVLARLDATYAPQAFVVENNGYQQALVDWATAAKVSFWPKIETFTTGQNKHAHLIGLPALQVEFQNRSWVIPYSEYEAHPIGCPCAWCRIDYEFRNHPTAETSDGVMALWFARKGIEDHLYMPSTDGGGLGNLLVR